MPGVDPEAYRKATWHVREEGRNLFLFLDSVWPRSHEGGLRGDELAWIHETLTERADLNVFLFMHHGRDALFNRKALLEVLDFHRPRFRQITIAFGHRHRNRNVQQDGGIQWLSTGALLDGSYRVFHVHPDSIVTYVRRSTAWDAMNVQAGEVASDEGVALVPDVLPSTAASATPHPPATALPRAATWRGNDHATAGDVLRLNFAAGDGRCLHDRSGYGNDLYSNMAFEKGHRHTVKVHRFGDDGTVTQERLDTPVWIPRDTGFAMTCGLRAAQEFSSADSYSLNAPSLHNRLTVGADLSIPEQPVGFAYGIVGQGSYELVLEPDGTVAFMLPLRAPDGTRHVRLATPHALAAGKWHRISGSFDGKRAILRIDGHVIAEADAREGERMVPHRGGVRVAYLRARQDANSVLKTYRIDNIRVAGEVKIEN